MLGVKDQIKQKHTLSFFFVFGCALEHVCKTETITTPYIEFYFQHSET